MSTLEVIELVRGLIELVGVGMVFVLALVVERLGDRLVRILVDRLPRWTIEQEDPRKHRG